MRARHDTLCDLMIEHWRDERIDAAKCSYGRGAKVIAIYLKTVKGMPGESPGLLYLYPPVDRQLLVAIRGEAEGGEAVGFLNWTKMDRGEHVRLMEQLRRLPEMAGRALWEVERWWDATGGDKG